MIFRTLIQMLIILLVGTRNQGPVHDLRKKPTREDHLKTLNCIFQKYYYVFVALFLLAVLLVFIGFCFAFVGTSGVESGNYYYHLKEAV